MQRKLIYKILLILGIVALCVFYTFPLGKRINLGLDLQGGMYLLLKVDTNGLSAESREAVTDLTIEKLRNRIDDLGVSEPSIQRHGANEIVVQLPGVTDRERALKKIGQTGLLEFKFVSNDPVKLQDAVAGVIPEGYELRYTKEDNRPLLLEKKAVLTGDAIKDARQDFSSAQFSEIDIKLQFNPDGAKKFAELTATNVGRSLAIVLDGKIQSAPNIREAIPNGEAVITGNFTVEQAQSA